MALPQCPSSRRGAISSKRAADTQTHTYSGPVSWPHTIWPRPPGPPWAAAGGPTALQKAEATSRRTLNPLPSSPPLCSSDPVIIAGPARPLITGPAFFAVFFPSRAASTQIRPGTAGRKQEMIAGGEIDQIFWASDPLLSTKHILGTMKPKETIT